MFSFTPLVGVLFTFPSRYWFAIGHARVLRLGGWSPQFQTGFHVSRPTRGPSETLCLRGYHPLVPSFPTCSASSLDGHWPGPRSLAATDGVSVDVLSFGYLDVSVPRVRFLPLFYSKVRYLIAIPRNLNRTEVRLKLSRYLRWVAPFGNPRIKAYSQLPMAYRSVSRPSSPVHAKASTRCPYIT